MRSSQIASNSPDRIRLCIVTTIGHSIQILYAGRLEYMMANGFDVTVCCASSEVDDAIRARGARLQTFPLTRAVTPWRDFKALLQLYRFLRNEKFDIVEVSTPKAALIGSIAAWLARCPCLVHVLRGLAYDGKRGPLASIIRMSASIPCRLADATFAVSQSVRERSQASGLSNSEQIQVLGAGSGNGVDLVRFSPERRVLGSATRTAYNLSPDNVVIGFIGRLTRDKGIEELVDAFGALHAELPQTVLLLVGGYEARDKPSTKAMQFLSTHDGVRQVGWQDDVLPFMAAMDILVLPTYREGLSNVLLEAGAMGIPTVTTDATGARDGSVDGVTGLQVPVGNAAALKDALARLMRDASLREKMGRAGREWVSKNFDRVEVHRRYTDAYRALVEASPKSRLTRARS